MSTISVPVQEYVQAQIATALARNNEEWFDAWNITINEVKDTVAANSRDMDIAWLVICGALVFFMQAGFAMLEAGIVHKKNVANILFKNMIDASIAAVCFWLVGYGLAYGDDKGGFIGGSNFGCEDIYNGAGGGGSDGWEGWFFQWAFTGACATIVAGSVAERTKIEAYFVYSIVLTIFIYPVVVHWGWGAGWLSAWGAHPDSDGVARPIFKRNTDSNGMIDFAGSGIVHMVGGWSGLMGAIVVGPRIGRFDPLTRKPNPIHDGDKVLQSLGAFILWFGWYGFNCGSTLMISGGAANVAGKVAMTTTISAAAGCLTASVLGKLIEGHFDVSIGLNGILVVNPWMAFVIGFAGAIILVCGHYLILSIGVDDPCDACVVHGFCGMWGLWATGIFCTDANIQYAAYPNVNDACGRGEQFGVQVVASLAIMAWTVGTAGVLFLAIHSTMGMRVDEDVENAGLDISEHGLADDPYRPMEPKRMDPPEATRDMVFQQQPEPMPISPPAQQTYQMQPMQQPQHQQPMPVNPYQQTFDVPAPVPWNPNGSFA